MADTRPKRPRTTAEAPARLKAELEREEVGMPLEAAQALATCADVDHVLQALVDVVLKSVDHNRAAILLWDEETETLDFLASRAKSPATPFPRMTLKLDELSEPAQSAARARTTAVIDYDALGEPAVPFATKTDSHLLLAVPLLYRERLLGCIILDDPGERHDFAEREIRLTEGIGVLAAIAIENARMCRSEVEARLEARRELERTAILLSAGDALATRTSLNELLGALGEVILDSVAHSRVTIDLWDEDRREFTVAASVGKTPVQTGTIIGLSQLSPAVREAAELGRPTVVDFEALTGRERGVSAEYASRLALDVPLTFHGRLVGFVFVDDPGERREFDEREIEIITSIAAQATVAVENARLFDKEREASRLGDALNAVDSAIHGTLQFDDIAQRVADVATGALGADTAEVLLRQPRARWLVNSVHGLPADSVGSSLADKKVPEALLAIRTGSILTIEDAEDDERVNRKQMAAKGDRAVLVMPLIRQQRGIGVIFFNYKEPHRFTPAETAFAGKLTSSVSLAIDNALLYDQQHRIAETLQTALLSMPERVANVEFAHLYHSATEAARVGGDFYDLFALEPGCVGVTVGDVAGKGLEAAVLTSLMKNTIRAHATDKRKSPADVLALTNTILYRESTPETFVTVFFGVIDTCKGSLAYSSAGHTTGAILGPRGLVRLPANSPLIGAFPDPRFEVSVIDLSPEEVLFLYTDGLIEARRGSEFYTEKRLFDALASFESPRPGELVGTAVEAVVEFAGGRLSDDLAVLAVQIAEDISDVCAERDS